MPISCRASRRRRPYDYDRKDTEYCHYTSEAICLAVRIVGTDPEVVAWAEVEARAQIAKGTRRDAIRSLVAALILLHDAEDRGAEPEPWIDALLALDQAPASTYVRALGDGLGKLP